MSARSIVRAPLPNSPRISKQPTREAQETANAVQLLHRQVSAWGKEIDNSIDGAAGGRYAPRGVVDVQGAGVAGNIGGQVAWRIDATTIGDGNYYLDVSKDVYRQKAGTPHTADHSLVLRHTTTGDPSLVPRIGARIRYTSHVTSGAAHTLSFKREDGTTLATIDTSTKTWVVFEYTSDGWSTAEWASNVTVSA